MNINNTMLWYMKPGSLLFHTIACTLTAGVAVAQLSSTGSKSDMFGDIDRSAGANALNIAQPRGLALESTIDPLSYFVGPSDVFSVNIWISPPVNLILTVTPEGTLIVPTVGEIRIADMTLAEAKRKVLEEIKKKYIFGTASVTLMTPRPIVVIVTGSVLNPGSYIVGSYYRADKAIEEANAPQRTQDQADVQNALVRMSTRNISVRHKDGTVSHVDIPKFLASKDDRWNPYLREGDLIIVPQNNLSKNVIGVYGEVNVPGRFEFVEGDSIKDALNIAYGFTRYALKDSLEFTRFNPKGVGISTSFVNGTDILDGRRQDIALQPGDRIVVKSTPDQRSDFIVTVAGEVKYPGVYPISKRSTRLSEVIARAGGFTEFASLRNAELSRHSVQPGQIQLEHLESLHGGVPSEDTAYYYLETNLRLQKEIVSVDFERLFVHGDSTQDVAVQNGDYVSVPSYRRTVYVFGQVVSPGYIPYVAGENVEYYVRKAGGYTDRARGGDVKVVKAKSKQWLSPDETTVEEGDYIWVPKEIERSFAYYMNIIGQTASIVSVGVSIVLLVIQSKK